MEYLALAFLPLLSAVTRSWLLDVVTLARAIEYAILANQPRAICPAR